MEIDVERVWGWLFDNALIALYGAILLWGFAKLKHFSFWAAASAPVFYRKYRRRRARAFLNAFATYEAEPQRLNLEINRSGVYLTLFWLCSISFSLFSWLLGIQNLEVRNEFRTAQFFSSLPIYYFEIMWLHKSFLVSDVFRRRRTLRVRRVLKGD